MFAKVVYYLNRSPIVIDFCTFVMVVGSMLSTY